MRETKIYHVLLVALLSLVLLDSSFSQVRYDVRAWSRIASAPAASTQTVADNPSVHYSSVISSSALPPTDSPDVQVTNATNTTQSEASIFVSPLNDMLVLNSNNSSDYPVSTIYGASGFISSDGGVTWTGSVNGTGGPNSGDPAVAIGLNGRFYNNYIADDGGNGTAHSTNNGATWTHVQVAPNPGSLADKNHMWVDNSPTSPYANNLYAAWTDFGGSFDSEIMISRSTDAGLTWSPKTAISTAIAAGSHNQGVNISTGPNGDVYVTWAVYDSWPSLESTLGFAKSTDGGVTWQPAVRAITNIKGIRSQATGGGLLGGKDMRTASFPSMAVNMQNGHIYIVWTNIGVPGVNTGTERDVYLAKSTDGGATWGTAVRVNQDDANNGKDQWFPWISCDPVTGFLVVAFYDSRDFPSNDQANTYVAISRNDGTSWEDFRVSDASWSGDGSGTGFSANYAGDYIGISARNGKVYPVWADRRLSGGRLMVWVSPFLLADPDDPNAPSAVSSYSDFTTPTSISLRWTNPTTLVNGDPIGPYVVRIMRDGAQIAEVSPPESTYTDSGAPLEGGGLTPYQLYSYDLITRLLSNDSLSSATGTSWHAGGSPYPAAPSNPSATVDTAQAHLSWTNPTTQKDGTPIHDFAGSEIWRNGLLIDSVGAGVTSYVDTPPPGFVYSYQIRGFNSLNPRRYSDPSAAVGGYVGQIPDVLVWQPSDALANSGDAIVTSLTNLGVSNYKSDDLFYFGSNLSQYNAIFVVLGTYSDNHVIGSSDPEGPALDAYVNGGGRLYLEGGDAFNYDPETGGYQIRPIFGLNDGADGGADVTAITGTGILAGMSFPNSGGNNFMDELHPNSNNAARTLFVAPGSSPANDTMAVYNFYGSGRSIAMVVEFGGLDDNAEMTGSKDSLMSKMIQFFNAPQSVADIDVSPASVADTLQSNETGSKSLTVYNTPLPPADALNVTLSESAPWVSLNPTSGSIGASGSLNVSVDFDATGLAPGNYTTDVTITSNDPDEPSVTVGLTLTVTGSPTIVVVPDTMFATLPSDTLATLPLVIKNTGVTPLTWAIADVPGQPSMTAHIRQPQADELYPPALGRDGWPMSPGKNDVDNYHGPAQTAGQGGPDSAGYRWIDSDEPGGPTFNWVDITSVGTPIGTGEWSGSADDGHVIQTLPFPMTFYGNTYNSIKIVTNGWVSFDVVSTNHTFTNVAIPASAEPNNVLATFWDDLDLRTQGTVHYYNDAANGRYIVQWTNVPHYTGTPGTYTFEVILYADGRIVYQYLDMQQTVNSSTIGIENPSGTVGLQVVYNNTYAHNNLAILIAKDVAWLSESPTSGTVAPGDSAIVDVTFNTAGLTTPEALYTGVLQIVSNDFGNTPKNVPVRLLISGAGGSSIGLTSPNGGESWTIGQTYQITWVKNNVDTVKIEYSTNSGSTWTVISNGYPARVTTSPNPKLNALGSYAWLVPNTPSTTCLVRVSDKANASISDVSNAVFTIVTNTPPVVEGFADHVTSAFRASVTNEGNIGSLNAFVGTGPGNGFQFNPISTTGQRLFEGGIMIGLDSVRVSNASRNNANPEAFDADFKFLSNLDSSASAGIRRSITTSYNDTLAETPFGVKVTQTSVTWDSAGLANFIIFQLDLQNTTGTPYSGLMAGGYFDWDVNPTNAQDRGQVVVDSTNTIPGVNGGSPFPFDAIELHQGVSPTAWVGVVPLNENRFKGRRVAIQSTEVYPPHMTKADKWLYMTTNRATNPNGDNGSAVDHGQVFGMGPYNVGAGATKRVGFAIASGTSLANFVNAARAAQAAWVQRLGNSINVVLTDVRPDPTAGIPETFTLEQNYPNPFNPTTNIQFGLSEQAHVTLKIYDLLGREVAILADGQQVAGVYSVEWNGQASTGSIASSGVYFYRLEARAASGEVFTAMKKMVLMK